MSKKPRELVLLSRAQTALAQARTIDEVRDLRNQAEVVKAYARKARLGQHILVEAAAIKVQAERKLGELLQELPLAKAASGNQHSPAERVRPLADRVRLADLGISKSDSSRAKQLAGLPDDVFQGYLAENLDAGREPTTAGLLRLARQRRANDLSDATRAEGSVTHNLQTLIDQGAQFATVYADPPWPYHNRASRGAAANRYPAMSIEQICAEPVDQLCCDHAHLHLWTTNGFLAEAFEVIEAWGFTYKSCFLWVKPQLGVGNYWRVSHEFLLLGVRGRLTFRDRSRRSWIEVERTVDSRKPDVFREIIEQVSPAPYLEMYAREACPGSAWTAYGNQVQYRLL